MGIQLSKSDLAGARALITPRLQPVGPVVFLSQALIQRFADSTFDFNPRHVDPQKAAAGQTIAHGLHAAALVPHLASDLRPFALFHDAQCMLHEVRSIKFGRPIRVNSTVHCLGRVAEVQKKGNGILVVFEWQVMCGVGTKASYGIYDLLYH